MKISKDVIETFKVICHNEKDTSDKDVEFKVTRAFDLAPLTKVLGEETYIKQFGTLCLLYSKGKIISLYKGQPLKKAKINTYEKYKYNYDMGRDDLNVRYK